MDAGPGMMKALVLTAFTAISVLAAGPAAACRGLFAEEFLIWYRLPELLPGEVAIEIDMRDFVENLEKRDKSNPEYRIKQVLVGAVAGQSINVRPEGSSCSREAAGGVSEKLILIGRLGKTPVGEPVLIPRYMPYDDPSRVNAETKLPVQ